MTQAVAVMCVCVWRSSVSDRGTFKKIGGVSDDNFTRVSHKGEVEMTRRFVIQQTVSSLWLSSA